MTSRQTLRLWSPLRHQRKQQRDSQPRLSQEPWARSVLDNRDGWYTFEHRFYNKGLGVLAVDLRITTLSGEPLHTWT